MQPYPNPYPYQPPPPPKSGVPTWAIVLGALFFGGICLLGVGAAIAIPAFTRFNQRAKMTEATSNLATIYHGVTNYYVIAQERGGQRLGAQLPMALLPPPTGRTPAIVPSGVRVTDAPGAWDTPGWQAIGFSIAEPHYYSYEYINHGDGSFTVRAYGDLDGDGVQSVFERTGRVNAQGEIVGGPLSTTNELE